MILELGSGVGSVALSKWYKFLASRPVADDVLRVLLVTSDMDVREEAWNHLNVLQAATKERMRTLISAGIKIDQLADLLLEEASVDDCVAVIVHSPERRNTALNTLLGLDPSLDSLRVAYFHCSDRRHDLAAYILVQDATAADCDMISRDFHYFGKLCDLRKAALTEREKAIDYLLQVS